MKKCLIVGLFTILFTSTCIYAQDVKTLPWKEFFQDIRLGKIANGDFEFTHGTEALEYTMVSVPANTLHVKSMYKLPRNMGEMLLCESGCVYIVTTNTTLDVPIKIGDLTVIVKNLPVRLTFKCKESTEIACRYVLASLLTKNVTMQSLGVGDRYYRKTGAIQETMLFAFWLDQ